MQPYIIQKHLSLLKDSVRIQSDITGDSDYTSSLGRSHNIGNDYPVSNAHARFMNGIAIDLLVVIGTLVLGGCSVNHHHSNGAQQDSTRSLCNDFPSTPHPFDDFHFLDGRWYCSDILKCQGGSLYTDYGTVGENHYYRGVG